MISRTNVNMNTVPIEPSTTLMLYILIDGKEILPQVLQNEEVTKGVLMGWMHVYSLVRCDHSWSDH